MLKDFITNYGELATSRVKKDALSIALAGIGRVLPEHVLAQAVRFHRGILAVKGNRFDKRFDKRFDISKGRCMVIGGGKGSGKLAQLLESIIGPDNLEWGMVNDTKPNSKTRKIIVNKAAHPYPDQAGVRGVRKMLEHTGQLSRNDTLLCIICGGGSALLPCPAQGITLSQKRAVTELLLKAGAEVFELNIVRKHLSAIKGGQLLACRGNARVISLIVSDTLNTTADATASGPTMADPSTFRDAIGVLRRYRVLGKVAASVRSHLSRGIHGRVPETVKKKSTLLRNVHNFVLVDNRAAVEAMLRQAKKIGYPQAKMVRKALTGTADCVSKQLARIIDDIADVDAHSKRDEGFAIVAGGETTVAVRGTGKGGRNQELAALMMRHLQKRAALRRERFAFISLASDGADYVRNVGGAMLDDKVLRMKGLLGMIDSSLRNNDTYHLHQKLGTLIRTTQCDTNVADLFVFVQRPRY